MLATPETRSSDNGPPAHEMIDQVYRRHTRNGCRFHPFYLNRKNCELLQSICSPEFRVSGITNKALWKKMSQTGFGSGHTDKQLSAKVSRHLQLLRSHEIIQRLSNQKRYQLMVKDFKLTNVLNAVLPASTEKLMKMAA